METLRSAASVIYDFCTAYPVYVIGYLAVINIVAFSAYGIDKHKAKNGKWRIPETTLIALAAFGGSLGSLLGMRLLRHKTQHMRFIISVPLFLMLHLLAAVLIIVLGR
ncbi:MAG: DUF1294 domain-containing protein [Clostridiales bacterium]|nr:DUF1294 domain-containing protein [Clostridiales bacterium]